MRYSPTGTHIVFERGQNAADGPRRLEVVDAATGALVATFRPGFNPRWLADDQIVCESPDGASGESFIGGFKVNYVPANRGQLDANGHGVWAVSDLRKTDVFYNATDSVVLWDAREPRLSALGLLAARHPQTGELRIFTDRAHNLGPCEDARWSSETLLWWLGGRVWGRTTPEQATVELTVPGRSCSHALPYWDGETLWIGLVLDAGELWVTDWAELTSTDGEVLGWRVGRSDGSGFDWDMRKDGGYLSVCYFDPLGKPVYVDGVLDALPMESMLKPAPVDPWELAEPGTLVTDAFRWMFGDAPSLSPDGRRICLHKNVDQAEWREVPADGWVYHLFDRSRGEDVPTGPRQGWYLTPRECCRWCALSFRSGDTFSVNGEKVEWDTGARVRWTHRITMFALKHGGVMIRFDPRFPNQDYGPEKLYEDHYNSPTAGVRWIARYAPESDKGKPWAYRDTDVVAADNSAKPEPGPTPAYLECPRLSVDSDPWAPQEPDPMPIKPRETFYAEFREVNAFYAAPEGLQRPGGMVIDTAVPVPADTEAMAAWGYDLMLGASVEDCKARIRQSDEWKAKHPNGGGSGGGGGTPPEALVPLSIAGTTFRRPDGTVWKYRMVTAFTAFQDFLAGNMSKLDAYAAWTRSVGGNGWRIFYTWVLTDFRPLRQLGQGPFMRELEAFRKYMDGQGLYSHNTALCDQVPGSSVLLSAREQDEHVYIVTTYMQGRIVEGVNEAYKNGGYELSARLIASHFHGTFGTRSSWADGDPTTAPGPFLACTSEHTPRDAEWPRKAKNLIETSTLGIQGVVSGIPAIAGEPIGIFETDIPGSRTANASDVADYFAVAELFGAGACLHGDGTTLQRCQLPGPNAQRCAEWAHQARLAVPPEAQNGHYTRGGLDDCPLEHSDSMALRTFAMLGLTVATAVVVRPAPGWEPKARNGWRIASVGGPNGHVIGLER